MSSLGWSLCGRASECETLREIVSAAQSGSSQVLVLRGEAGVGKTALLGQVIELAPGFPRVEVAGVQSDMELAYAGLQQLCAPLMTHIDGLPEPQREALNVAFGRGVGPTPDRFLVGLAVLSLIAAAANDQPLLCVIDDAQWLDQVSLQTLAFVARRLVAEPVVMVFAARDRGAEVLMGLPVLVIGGLSDIDARGLLDAVVLGRIDERVRDRIVAETRGIPLALLEVPRNVSSAELAGGFGNLGVRRSAGQIEEGYVQRIRALPMDTQKLLLVAAADPAGDAALFLRTAARLGIAVDALAPAEAAGVIEFGTRMRFHHPLVRSAAYRAADLTDRRAIHRALADATDPQSDPDRRAWHAASASAGPDDEVASELETSAGRAQRRGGGGRGGGVPRARGDSDGGFCVAGVTERSRLHERSVTPPLQKRPKSCWRLPSSGRCPNCNGPRLPDLRAQMEFARSRGGGEGAPRLAEPASKLLDVAKRLEPLDGDLARETYLEALAAAMYAGRLGAADALDGVALAARSAVRGATGVAPSDRFVVERHGGPHHRRRDWRRRASARCTGADVPTRAAERRPSPWLDVTRPGHRAGVRRGRTVG